MRGSTVSPGAASLVLGLALGAATPVAAQTSGEDLSILAGTCVTCHGPQGRSVGAMPTIAGKPAAELEAMMLGFRDGSRTTGTVMPRLMKGFSEAQIAALATWFEEVGP